MALCADDTDITYQSQQPALVISRLQMHANQLADWFIKWNIAISAGKSEALLFQGRWRHHLKKLHYGRKSLTKKKGVEIFGSHYRRQVNIKNHCQEVRRKFIAARMKYYLLIE